MAETRQQERHAEAVARVARALVQAVGLDQVLATGMDEALAVLGVDHAAIYLVRPDQQELALAGHRNFRPETVELVRQVPIDAPMLAAQAYARGQTQVVEDLSVEVARLPFARRIVDLEGTRSVVAAPLCVRAQVSGVLVLGARVPHRFAPPDLALVDTIADLLAAALEQARLLEAERERARDNAILVEAAQIISASLDMETCLRETARLLARVFDPGRSSLWLRPTSAVQTLRLRAFSSGLEGADWEPFAAATLDLQHELMTRRVVDARQVVTWEDARTVEAGPVERAVIETYGLHSVVGAPICAWGQVLGVAYVDYRGRPRRFAEREIALIGAITSQLGAAMERAYLHAEVEQERSQLRAVLEGSPVGIVVLDAVSGSIALASRAAEAMFGRLLPEGAAPMVVAAQLRRPDGTPWPPEELLSWRAMRGEAVYGVEQLVRRPDGSEVPILTNVVPLRDAQGRVTGIVALLLDLSRIKELERLREEFISIVAHDLRAPLTVISGYLGILKKLAEERETGAVERKALESIRVSIWRLNRMVADLLDASRIEAGRLVLEREPLRLSDFVPEVVERLAEVTREHPVGVEVRGELPPVEADPARVEQILANLLGNAAKYSPPGAEILVAVQPLEREVQVSITDHGSGIPAEELPRVFERFHRVRRPAEKREGLGLGLYITSGLVTAQGGRIWVESTLGQGSTFRFTLPTRSPRGQP